MNNPDQELIDKNARRAAGINALRKIGAIVAEERQADAEKAKVLRWFFRYGWIVLIGSALLLAYAFGTISVGVI